MLIPIGDDNSDRRSFPVVTLVLIALNVLVFVVFQGMGANDRFTYAFSAVPAEITTGRDLATEDHPLIDPATQRVVVDPQTRQPVIVPGLQATPVSVYLTLLTSIFMHGGVAHIFGNMLFLWIFGDNVEDDMGKLGYTIFYLLAGLLASLAHVATNWNSQIPSLGASGAISGVLGAYMLFNPMRRVQVLMFRFITEVPAFLAIGIWFLFQLVQGLGMLGGRGDGVAYAAHIGGFVAGMALAPIFINVFGTPRGNLRLNPRRTTANDLLDI